MTVFLTSSLVLADKILTQLEKMISNIRAQKIVTEFKLIGEQLFIPESCYACTSMCVPTFLYFVFCVQFSYTPQCRPPAFKHT